MLLKSDSIPRKGLCAESSKTIDQAISDETGLWKAFKKGNKQAFSVIYQQNVKVLYHYGRKIINNKDLVEDCIQDLFYELWERRDRLSDTDSIKYYLLKSLRIKLLKEIEKNHKFLEDQRIAEYAGFQRVSSYEEELVEEQFQEERKENLSHVLNGLPARQKEAVFLRYYGDLNFEEIASIMSINHQSVHNLIYRAIKILRKGILHKQGILLLAASLCG